MDRKKKKDGEDGVEDGNQNGTQNLEYDRALLIITRSRIWL